MLNVLSIGMGILLVGTVMALSGCGPSSGGKEGKMGAGAERTRGYPVVLVIHGGAGNITRNNLSSRLQQRYRMELERALTAGYRVLTSGGDSVEAVIAAITTMEDSPWFNAGKGAVLTHDETVELDASLMDGGSGLAGAVAGVKTIKNPIVAAQRIMTHSPYVMLIAQGAEAFARAEGLTMVDPEYFYTRRQLERLRRRLKRQGKISRSQAGPPENGSVFEGDNLGTVGAVALDRHGDIAAGTSTGGTIGKRYGRVGDSAVIGAGTYADNETCGISATGHGEFFIRNVVAYDIAARMKYRGQSLQEAAREVIGRKLGKIGGSGGVIGLDRRGHVIMEFNTPGMYRGFMKEKGKPSVFLFGDESP